MTRIAAMIQSTKPMAVSFLDVPTRERAGN
jgi:hypothetical protein